MTSFHHAPQSAIHDQAALLDRLQTPLWVFDIEQERMHYANAAAVRLWGAETPQALYARDFSATMSEATRRRLADYLPRLARGEVIDEHWSFYPGGQAISLHCRCSRYVTEEGRTGMLVEGLESDISLDASSLRALEAVRHTPMMVSVFDGQGRLLVRNPAALAARQGLSSFAACFSDYDVAGRLLQQLEGEPRTSLEAMMRVDDSDRWHHVDLCRATDPKTGLPMIVMGEFDITPRKALETAQLVSNRQLEVVIEGLDVGLLLEDESRRVIVANQAFCDLFDIDAPPEHLVGMDCREAAESTKGYFTEPEGFVARIEELLVTRRKQARDLLAMADGRFLERTYTPLFVADQYHGHLWVYRDITRQRHQEADWARKASTDPLTGLANRRSFDDAARRVARTVKGGEIQAALLMIDIDRFKAINDTLGHAEGDKGLRLLADTLRHHLRQSDLPCRTGGEEFMVILPGMSPEEARAVAWRLLRQIAEATIEAEALPFHFTVSIGVTCFTPTDASIEAVTQRADAAMYQAKREGRNRVAVRW
ncbi:sensor domain-containing diguanylate cyclase [Halomonas sp. LR5S13]|uniref:sensor domain-containing diguanylate cyclase n=1 Tax=Halomonas rhizosphaerae TaxID=3043296 RepID=UPI0024A89826|nr:sensor domain-containing diguanylate cyclase [Halomonas rhizosphaerae]MDI5919767.1 sensor domain-containing diguanylate cyclase [Halomonas rhizosphaerae]